VDGFEVDLGDGRSRSSHARGWFEVDSGVAVAQLASAVWMVEVDSAAGRSRSSVSAARTGRGRGAGR
jgi:hypothetical protein